MSKVLVNESSLTGIADAIRGKNGETTTYKPSEMAAAITAISGGGGGGDIPEEVFVISGDCSYWDYHGKWDGLITAYTDKWSFSNITNCNSMFQQSKIKNLSLNINMTEDGSIVPFDSCFYNAAFENLPNFIGNNVAVSSTHAFFEGLKTIKNIPDDYFSFIGSVSGNDKSKMFCKCNSLRNFPSSTNIIAQKNLYSYAGGSVYNSMCSSCYCLDEIVNLGVNTNITYTSNAFSSIVTDCYRLKNFTFESGKTARWKKQTIELIYHTGYAQYTNYIVNNGITADKQVTDATTYAALKDDPDWWTTNVAYSRYNHDSAVATINSLPDTSAYLAANGGNNTIMFTGAAGSATDGGAINTLTQEEIAVATAKGWTVTLV